MPCTDRYDSPDNADSPDNYENSDRYDGPDSPDSTDNLRSPDIPDSPDIHNGPYNHQQREFRDCSQGFAEDSSLDPCSLVKVTNKRVITKILKEALKNKTDRVS